MRRSAALWLALLASACSIAPVYHGSTATTAIDIAVSSERQAAQAAYHLRQELQASLILPGLTGPARLEIVLEEELDRLAFERDQQVTRTAYRLHADYVLRDATGAALVSDSISTGVAYEPQGSPVADILAQTDMREEAALAMATALRTSLVTAMAEQK